VGVFLAIRINIWQENRYPFRVADELPTLVCECIAQ